MQIFSLLPPHFWRNLVVVVIIAIMYLIMIITTDRSQRRTRRKEYQRLVFWLAIAESPQEIENLTQLVEQFKERYYDQNPGEVSDFYRLLRRMVDRQCVFLS